MFGVAGERRLPRTKQHRQESPTIKAAALNALCPRCGAQSVFEDMVRFQLRCSSCHLDLAQYEAGGRFAAFVTVLAVAVLTAASILVDEALGLPFWAQILIWVPLTMASVIYAVRLGKSTWLALRYAKAQLPD